VEFGIKLKELRLNAGLTQQQLATQLGITKSVVSYYELQERYPSPEVLIKIASVFHVSTDYLLGIEKNYSLDTSGLNAKDIHLVSMMVEHLRNKNNIN
jgi:Predicted transcriptional regulators